MGKRKRGGLQVPAQSTSRPVQQLPIKPVEQLQTQHLEPPGPRSAQSFIEHWASEKSWPKSYFTDNVMDQWVLTQQQAAARFPKSRTPTTQSRVTAERTPSASSSRTPAEQSRAAKNAAYTDLNYMSHLSSPSVRIKLYPNDHELGVSENSRRLLEQLLAPRDDRPLVDTVFSDQAFDKCIKELQTRREARIFRDISTLLVPSPRSLAWQGRAHLKILEESVDESWTHNYPITSARPQPDSAVGYSLEVLTAEQQLKLEPLLGDISTCSFLKATSYMLLPFLTQEAKSSLGRIQTARNQNAHSMAVAVRAVVALFDSAHRIQDLHREVVGFAIVYNCEVVELSAYYPVVDDDGEATIWCHTVDMFALTQANKWRCMDFVKNIYDIYSPMHLERLRSAIDTIVPLSSGDEIDQALPSLTATSLTPSSLPQRTRPTSPLSRQLEPSSSSLSQRLEEQVLEGIEETMAPEAPMATNEQTGRRKRPRRGNGRK